ncbi:MULTISPECIES: GFA family protein [Xanthomonas]|uniref:GFA family protein n=1 Tax=Xanthomonas TaxID=338 RepID=UPI000E1E4D58|nr:MULTISPECIES: GFA family protein [Xanthomonas]
MNAHQQPHLHGRCACGQFSYVASQAPRARFICHCLFCQDFTGEAFSDVSVLLAHQLTITGADALVHKKYRRPPNLDRAVCANCRKPAMETMGAGPLKLVFVPSQHVVEKAWLPPVKLHAFYNRRKIDVADDLPKYSHYWPSQLAIVKTIMGL